MTGYQSAFHALTTMVNERGNTSTYAYDASGRLTHATDALGNAALLGYTGAGLLQTATDPLGNVTTYLYDAATRRQTGAIDALNQRSTLTYDSNGNVETTVDALGRLTTVASDAMGRTTAVTDTLGYTYTFTYDAAGLLLTTTDPLGAQSGTVYDRFRRGLVDESKQLAPGLSVEVLSDYDDAGRVTATRDTAGWPRFTGYDPDGRSTGTTDALGGTTRNAFDIAGQLTAARDEAGRWNAYAYDTRGRVTRVTDNLGNATTESYDRAGNLTKTTDALGRRTTSLYDALDRATVTIDALLRRMTTTYDAADNVSTASDRLGRVTSYAYDKRNRATKTTEAVGTSVQRTTETGYDEVGNVRTRKDGLGNVTTFLYDSLDRHTETIDPLGRRTTGVYDAVGSRIAVVDALGERTTYGHDGLHRPTTVQTPLNHVTTTVLDGMGRGAGTIDAAGNSSQAGFDPLGRGSGGLDGRGGFGKEWRDASGDVRLYADPAGSEWHWLRDGVGRVAVAYDPRDKATTVAYDAAGRATSVTNQLGLQTVKGYDGGDRLTAATWKSSAGVTVNLLTFTYDDNDNLLTAADSAGVVTLTYDELNRVKTERGVYGQALTFAYDARDFRTSMQDSYGATTTSAYDAAGRLTRRGVGSVSSPLHIELTWTDRDQPGTVSRYKDDSGSTLAGTTSYAYDASGRLTELWHKDGSASVLASYTFGLDAKGRMTSETANGTLKTYSYDSTDQLTQDGATGYGYDLAGNRNTAGYATGTANQLSNDGTWTYTYDDKGQLTKKSKGASAETWEYTFDHRGLMLTARKSASDGGAATSLSTFSYDVAGRRVQTQVWTQASGTTTTTRWVYDASNAFLETDGSNNLLVRRLYLDGPDQVFARIDSDSAEWYLTDRQGSVRDIVAYAGNTNLDRITYTAFGGVASETNAANGDALKYNGGRLDAETGLYHFGRRYYDPAAGRWVTRDPSGFGGGDFNTYRFVGNSVTNATDPDGRKSAILQWFQDRNRDIQWAYDQVFEKIAGAIGPDKIAPPSQANRLDDLQLILDGIGLIPFLGEPADLLNAGISVGRGNYGDAALSVAALVPILGWGATGTKLGGKVLKVADVGKAVAKPADLAVEGAQLAGKKVDDLAVPPNKAGFCFAAGTAVATESGQRPIEAVTTADRVWAYDFVELRWRLCAVTETFRGEYHCPVATLAVGRDRIEATGGHPFWVVRGDGLAARPHPEPIGAYQAGLQPGRWVLAQDLRAGDEVLLRSGEVVPIREVVVAERQLTVYNFAVEGLENYAVGDAGVLVHNTCSQQPGSTGPKTATADVVDPKTAPRGGPEGDRYIAYHGSTEAGAQDIVTNGINSKLLQNADEFNLTIDPNKAINYAQGAVEDAGGGAVGLVRFDLPRDLVDNLWADKHITTLTTDGLKLDQFAQTAINTALGK